MFDDDAPDTDELETEDTSKEEEDTEEEDSSNEEEDESTDDEDSEDSDESEEDSDEEESTESKTKQYIDLKKLPPELREAGKRMLASHTKAMQRIPEVIKQQVAKANEQLQQQYATAIVKAKGFDDLTNIPSFKEYWKDVEAGRPYGFSSRFRKNGKVAEAEEDFSAPAGDSKEGGIDVDTIVESLMPRIASLIKAEVGPIKEEKAKSVWADAEKNLPNFNKYRAAITAKLSDHPTLTIAEAYDLVAGKERVEQEVINRLKKAEEKAKKVPKRSLKPGSGGSKPLTKNTIRNIEDALQHARSDLTRASGG